MLYPLTIMRGKLFCGFWIRSTCTIGSRFECWKRVEMLALIDLLQCYLTNGLHFQVLKPREDFGCGGTFVQLESIFLCYNLLHFYSILLRPLKISKFRVVEYIENLAFSSWEDLSLSLSVWLVIAQNMELQRNLMCVEVCWIFGHKMNSTYYYM